MKTLSGTNKFVISREMSSTLENTLFDRKKPLAEEIYCGRYFRLKILLWKISLFIWNKTFTFTNFSLYNVFQHGWINRYFVKTLDTNIKLSFISFTCKVLKIKLTKKSLNLYYQASTLSYLIFKVFNVYDVRNVWPLSSKKHNQDSVYLWKFASVL